MQAVSSRIWTRVIGYISNDNKPNYEIILHQPEYNHGMKNLSLNPNTFGQRQLSS